MEVVCGERLLLRLGMDVEGAGQALRLVRDQHRGSGCAHRGDHYAARRSMDAADRA